MKTDCIKKAKQYNNVLLFKKWVIEGARTPDPQNHNLML